ncbi:MAG: DEAD/DEAH box helicase, partial [Thermoplasmata archaeon]|nr:DEAD/DEAH box helicase [Thermoplasmata archaeon]
TLVVLPTGLGKTAIALRVIAEWLLRAPTRSILFLAPTRPLVLQHARTVAASLFTPPPVVLTGTIPPDRRAALLAPPQIVVATPQVVGNDLARAEFRLEDYSLIIFDEAHRAAGDYPYVTIGEANRRGAHARVLAMTASPGPRLERIREVWYHLGIERFEYRTAQDTDVMPYVHGVGVETVEVPIPAEVKHLGILLRTTVARQEDLLRKMHRLPEQPVGRRELLGLGAQLRLEISNARREGQNGGAALWSAVTAQSVAMKGLHALELIETQGVDALRGFLAKQSESPGGRMKPAQRAFLGDPDVAQAIVALSSIQIEHPKVAKAVEIVTKELRSSPDSRVIIFTQYRQTADVLVAELRRAADPAVRAERFVGQASHGTDEGLTQKEQLAILDQFRAGSVNCLIATSVAEEGLDIPSTNLVLFYEPVPDLIRTIQRRGRTGRARLGRAIVLVAGGTRDVGLARSAAGKEVRMHQMLERVEEEAARGTLPPPPPSKTVQRSLFEYNAPS